MKKPCPAFLSLALLCLFSSWVSAAEPVPSLKLEPKLSPPPEGSTEKTPVFIRAQRIQGHQDQELEATGDTELRRRGQAIFADWMTYFYASDEIYAEGRIRIENFGDVIEGTSLRLNLDTERGHLDKPTYRLVENDGKGGADLLLFEGKNKYRMRNASYTTCPVGNDDWFLRVNNLEIDRTRQVGVARNASIIFKGVPILYAPWMDFPLGKQRKSGFLSPTFGSTNKGGVEFTLPYYWNIAPNRDATISPRIMAKRGLLLNNELRYLEPTYNGKTIFEVLPDDKVADRSRYSLNLQHAHYLGGGWSSGLTLQKVSDNAYFRDLGDRLAVTSQTNLLRDGYLSYGAGWGSFVARVQRYQTLQDPLAPLTPPYNRAPQLNLSTGKQNIAGADIAFSSEFVDFSHPSLVTGKRLTLYPSISYPLLTSAAYLTPKIGVHSTRYTIDRSSAAGLTDTTRTIPIFSLDSGLFFEREFTLRNERFMQTLEPRLYYVYAPFRDQSQLPNFDSALADFNFAQIFTENRFSGGDRISDANQVTLALTSRLLEPGTGNERARLTLAQRLHIDTPRVGLTPGEPNNTRSDFLAAVSANITPQWLADAGIQYNPNRSRYEKLSANTRYQPEIGKVLNLGYRFTRDSLEQFDVSAQWPLSGRWQGVGRYNYSMRDSRVLEGLAGLEYNGGCWVLRLVVQRLATATRDSASAFFVQLELNGLTRVGADPLDALRQSIPGYTKLNVPPAQDQSPYFR